MNGESKAVYAAIAEVTKAMSITGISKDRRNKEQGYSFRGIDDVLNALSSLYAQHGLVVTPAYSERTVTERQTRNGGALFSVVVCGTFTVYCSKDGSSITSGPFYGEAMDTADKATNKAMSASYKYFALQTFAIPTDADNDADATTHEVRAKPITAAQVAKDEYDALPPDAQKIVQEWAADVTALVDEGRAVEANEFLHKNCTTQEDKLAIWAMLGSKTRSALKKAANTNLASQA